MFVSHLGALVQANANRILIASTLGLLLLCVAIKTAKLDVELTSWIQRSHNLDALELENMNAQLSVEAGGSNQLLLQEVRDPKNHSLTVHALMVHLEALAIATQLTVDMFGVTWSLKDICFAPTIPEFGEGYNVAHLLDGIMPCAIKTPLDCFWEGAKLLGPDQPIRLRDSLPPFKWTSANPELLVEGIRRAFPHASFPYKELLHWMKRLGIGSGYQNKPCLDPTDVHCPDAAPNKRSQSPPDLGTYLAGGCHGVAANQMHWHEQEIIGGATRNSSGHLISAQALQSIIQLMGEHDMFEFWRKTDKVQDVSNWSTEKAKIILDTWQRQFKLDLAEFARTSPSAHPFKLYAITSNEALQPIQLNSLLDLYSFQVAFTIMTLYTCAIFPKLGSITKSRLLALLAASYVGLTFVASLGLSSFVNLPLNMATTQILPPLALYYGINQLNLLSQIFSRKHKQVPLENLTIDCLHELLPAIKLEFITYICTLLTAAIVPIPSTRVFAFQLLLYICLATLVTILLLPSLLIIFVIQYATDSSNDSSSAQFREEGQSMFTLSTGQECHSTNAILEEQIFSRIHDDLKNIQAEGRRPTSINVSANLDSCNLHTSFTLNATTSSKHGHDTSRQLSRSLKSNKTAPTEPSISRLSGHSNLPDIIANAFPKLPDNETTDHQPNDIKDNEKDSVRTTNHETFKCSKKTQVFDFYINNLTTNRCIQSSIYLIILIILVALLSQNFQIKYSIQLSDIIARESEEYESTIAQEKYFPVYNIFAVTKGNFDYSINQKLLFDYNQALEQVEGVIKDEGTSRFWLVHFRNWLLEIQQQFDIDRNKSAINGEGWNEDASEASKLAYKLLAQTGRTDNPVNKSIVETNRLVDSKGIINPKAFYYYLFAWVINDPFTYATSEACFKPEYRIEKWRHDPDILKIEKPQPITYAQIPILMNLPNIESSFKKIALINSISHFFEQRNLPNTPTGIPFLFWDQFATLDLTVIVMITASVISTFLLIGLTSSSFGSAAIIVLPIILNSLELYCSLGLLSVPINNIIAILLISTIGFITVQSIQLTTYFHNEGGDPTTRIKETLKVRLKTVFYSLLLFMMCILTFRLSKIDFIIKYSHLLFTMAFFNTINSLILVPMLLSNFGPKPKKVSQKNNHVKRIKGVSQQQAKNKQQTTNKKRRLYRKVNSELSLSTISEEPQSEAPLHDLKIDLSIRCY